MTHTPLLVKNDSEYFRVLTQVNSSGDSSVNHAPDFSRQVLED